MKGCRVVAVLMVLVFGLSSMAFGGGVDNKQNFSAAYMGSLSRNAATDGADIAAYNPAGSMLLPNGLFLELDAQLLSLDYTHTVDGTELGADSTIVVPGLFGIYKTDKWAAFGTFTINGGGGEVEYEDGNSITRGLGNAAAFGAFTPPGYARYEAGSGTTRPNNAFMLPGGVMTNEYAGVESYDLTFTGGLAYKINDMLSVSGALRYVSTKKDVDIHATYTAHGMPTNATGKYEQEADGIGGVLGVNIKPNDTVNIGLHYDTKVSLDWDTEILDETRGTVGENILWMNNRVHDGSYARDLPAVLGIGVEWYVNPKLALSPSFTYYFEKDADWGDQNEAVDDNSYDLALGLKYLLTEEWNLTAGYMYTDVGMDPEKFGIIEKMSPPLDCHTVAVGAGYNYGSNWRFTFGLAGSFYVDDEAPAIQLNPATEYGKTVYTGAVGIQYKFF